MSLKRTDSGKKGEGLASSFLKRRGYIIISRNYKTGMGEIDIIGNDHGCIAFVEVRSTSSKKFGLPEYTIDRKKQSRITKTALSYIKRFGLEDRDCRFDAVCIKGLNSAEPNISLIRNAFELNTWYGY